MNLNVYHSIISFADQEKQHDPSKNIIQKIYQLVTIIVTIRILEYFIIYNLALFILVSLTWCKHET